MAISTDDFVKKLFPEATSTPGVNTKKLALISVGSKFRVRSFPSFSMRKDIGCLELCTL